MKAIKLKDITIIDEDIQQKNLFIIADKYKKTFFNIIEKMIAKKLKVTTLKKQIIIICGE